MALNIGSPKLKRRAKRLVVISCICIMSLMLMGMGEKYRKQGGLVYKKILNVLVTENYCHDAQDCYRKEVIFGEHGNRVNWHLYGVHDQRVIASILTVVATEGATSLLQLNKNVRQRSA